MHVRPAILEDAQAIAEVHVKSWQGAYRGLLPHEYLAGLSVERRTQMWTRILSDSTLDVFVALDNDAKVVGFASLQASRDDDASDGTGEVTAIYVLPDYWGQGYGRALMDAALARAREMGFRAVTLWVLSSNARAKSFYEKAGFTTDGTEKTDTVGGSIELHEVRYRIELTRTS